MDNAEVSAETYAQQAIKLRLLTNEQVGQFRNEDGQLDMAGDEFLRLAERKGILTPWQTHKLGRGDTEGYYLGSYRVLYKVGSGSYGRVFRAEDPHTGTVVAMKSLRNRWNSDAHSIGLFEREAKIGLTLEHPNIVKIIDTGKDPRTEQ